MQADIKLIAEEMNNFEKEKYELSEYGKAKFKELTNSSNIQTVETSDDNVVNEAIPTETVDNNYIQTALNGLSVLKDTDPYAYKAAQTYLNNNFGRRLIPVEEFIKNRLKLANVPLTSHKPTAQTTAQTRDELMKSVANSWQDFKKQQDIETTKQKDQFIKSIWIKDIKKIHNDNYKVSIEYTDVQGHKSNEEEEFLYDTSDKYIKDIINSLRRGRNFDKITPFDVIIAAYHIACNDDNRIIWFYGPNKQTQKDWLHAPAMEKAACTLAKSPIVKTAKKKWLKQIDPTGAVVYRNGNTTIYKTESIDEADEKKQEAAVKDAVDSAKDTVSSKATAEDIKKLLPGPKLKKLRDKLVKSKVDKKTLDQYDKIVKFLDDYANGDIKESDVVAEAGKATTGLATIARGLAKLLLTLIKLTSLGIGIPAKAIILITQWIASGADKLNVLIKDSEEDEED